MNDQQLPYMHGKRLRLRNELQHGFKLVKWIKGIEFVADSSDIGSGYGGYSGDTAPENLSSPKPRTCRGYSEDTPIRA